jgi:hypothetical protein
MALKPPDEKRLRQIEAVLSHLFPLCVVSTSDDAEPGLSKDALADKPLRGPRVSFLRQRPYRPPQSLSIRVTTRVSSSTSGVEPRERNTLARVR